jgi:site-specific DNA recombinase
MPQKSKPPFAPGAQVVAYLRDSGHEDQELSTEQQEAAIRAWCLEQGLHLTRVYRDDAAPGSSVVGRAAFLEMIEYFHAPRRPELGVVIWKLNRFARDIDDAQFYKSDLRRRGYSVHSLNDTVPEGLDGRFFEAAIDWMNARYLQDLQADIIRGLHHNLHTHGAIGGTPPCGFMRQEVVIGNRRDGRPHQVARWVPDPDMIERVQLAWSLRANGASYSEVHRATHLYKSGQGVSYRGMFANRLYIGELVFGGEIVPDYCTPIIDQETWQRVQDMQDGRHKMDDGLNLNHPRRLGSEYLLSGLLVCANCGKPVNGASSRLSKRGTDYHYRYYACNGTDCKSARIPKEALEQAVIERLVKRILLPDNLARLMIGHEERIEDLNVTDRALYKTLSADLEDVRRQINNISDLLAEGDLGRRSLTKKLGDLEKREEEISAMIARLRLRKKAFDPKNSQDLAKKIRSALESDERIDETRAILRGLIDHISVAREKKSAVVEGEIFFYVLDDDKFVSMRERPWRDPVYRHKFIFSIDHASRAASGSAALACCS